MSSQRMLDISCQHWKRCVGCHHDDKRLSRLSNGSIFDNERPKKRTTLNFDMCICLSVHLMDDAAGSKFICWAKLYHFSLFPSKYFTSFKLLHLTPHHWNMRLCSFRALNVFQVDLCIAHICDLHALWKSFLLTSTASSCCAFIPRSAFHFNYIMYFTTRTAHPKFQCDRWQ